MNTKPWSKQRALEERIKLLESILTQDQIDYLNKLKQDKFDQSLLELSNFLEAAE